MDLSNQPIIQIKNVTRTFKDVEAVSDLSVEIYPGELFGLVGPDGAGKTTTLRILAGLLSLSGGEGSVAGFNLQTESEKIKKKIGYMAQRFSLYAELSVVENLKFFADLYDVPRAHVASRMDKLLEFANLTGFRTRRADKLSGGMQKKLALACCLIHEPEILLLDEPTTGVDPVSRREFWNILSDLHLSGTTIVVSTPYMDEADRCSEVGLMYEGKLIRNAPPKEIRSSLNAEMIVLVPETREGVEEILKSIQGVIEVQTYGDAYHILVEDAKSQIPKIEQIFRKTKRSYRELRVSPPRMEEAFISLMKGLEG
ncbi:MAG: ABC transporter ATP-binding protein [Anaerolineales bacterium]|jgi:ABC-2 type transport system ATP-binding protein